MMQPSVHPDMDLANFRREFDLTDRGSVTRTNFARQSAFDYSVTRARASPPDRGSGTRSNFARRSAFDYSVTHVIPDALRGTDPAVRQSRNTPYASRNRALLRGHSFGPSTSLAFVGLFSM
jgi:hypothetical protein